MFFNQKPQSSGIFKKSVLDFKDAEVRFESTFLQWDA